MSSMKHSIRMSISKKLLEDLINIPVEDYLKSIRVLKKREDLESVRIEFVIDVDQIGLELTIIDTGGGELIKHNYGEE